jgi:hypothetical protein
MAWDVSRENIPQWLLVGEFNPGEGEWTTLLLLAVVFLWRRQQNRSAAALLDVPAFWLLLLCWILGFKANRCWVDWGIPATLVWLTLQFEDGMRAGCNTASLKRLPLCCLLALPLWLHTTNDLNRRYTRNLDKVYLDGGQPALQGWLPETNGIFYSAQMEFFYDTFYKNPQAGWRYILGFEPALMPATDLKVYRAIQRQRGALPAYEPWINKLQSADRLVISSFGQPNLPRLEWTNAVGTLWIGRLPK